MEPGVGDTLREAREERGVAIEAVAASTKIQPRLLRALEAEDWDALPGDFYASRFLHTYAQYLGLDGAALVADYERVSGADRGGREGSRRGGREPRVEPKPLDRARAGRRGTGVARARGGLGPGTRSASGGGGIPMRAVGAAVILVAIVVGFVAVVTGSGGGGKSGGGAATTTPASRQAVTGKSGGAGAGARAGKNGGAGGRPSPAKKGTELTLTTKAEVWVCLLNAKGNALIKGQILPAGEIEGPFRSAAFTVALGNGAVEMEVDGKPVKMAASADPVGFKIGRHGGLTALAEGERPTCA